MPVCRYYQTNSCRYGAKCRYEHVRESPQYSFDSRPAAGVSVLQRESQPAPPRQYQQQDAYSYRNDRYHYQSDKFSKRYQQDQDFVQHRSPMAGAKPTNSVSDYLEMIAKEVPLIENQNLWPLTCLGIFRGHGSLPDWTDYSPEELRYEAYKALKEGTFPVYIQEVKNLLDKAKAVRASYLHPNKMTESIVMRLLEQSEDKEVFQPIGFSDSVIANEGHSTAKTFGTAQSAPTGPAFSFDNTPAFGATNHPTQQNIFGSVLNSRQQTNFFGNSFQNNTPSGFQLSNQMAHTSMFGNQRPSADHSMALPEMTSGFGKQEDIDRGSGPRNCMIDPRIEDLTKQELEQYNANTFTFGLVPIIPPPDELCPK